MATLQEAASMISELRKDFQTKHKENINGDKYDSRDLLRLENDDIFARNFVWAFRDTKKNSLNINKSVEMVDKILQFRKERRINDLSEDSFPMELKEKDVLFWKGVDKHGHKILHFRVCRQKKGHLIEETKSYVAYFLEAHQRTNPGESIIVIFDFKDAGVSNMDLDLTRFIITSLTVNFPGSMEYILLFEMPMMLSAIWMVIKGWLSTEEQSKTKMVKKSNIQEYIDASELVPHMCK